MSNLTNTNVNTFTTLIKPNIMINEVCEPVTKNITNLVLNTRNEIQSILEKKSKKKLFIVGPCSIHDIDAAKEYGSMLKNIADKVKSSILVVMRVYFEKPRTTIGWKGLINDPHLDNSFDVNEGLKQARNLLIYLNSIGMPCACEFLDVITPQYISDLISWGAIGARTTESQVHRQMVSGMSMPVGFKNGTGGSLKLATDAVLSAQHSHCFMAINDYGEPSICQTKGNPYCHIILRGGKMPNYDNNSVIKANDLMEKSNIKKNIIIDCSHGNSNKNYEKQKVVLKNILEEKWNGNIESRNMNVIGVMIESNIYEGKQTLTNKDDLRYGVSITDSCISIDETEQLLLDVYLKLTYTNKN
jgi:3-deoxy-7-phosphoheptulonate synthase